MSALFPTYSRWNIEVSHAKGTKLYDTDGKEYLDFVSGIAVCNLGHCHPKVTKAVEEQLHKIWHASNLFHVPIQEEVAQLLVQNSAGDYVFFCNSGAEANEAAIKLARKHTQKAKIITFYQSFHGRTFATMAATGQEKIQKGFGPLLEKFEYLPYNDIEALQNADLSDVAAIMLEVIQGEGGVHPATEAFIEKVKEVCEKNDCLLIVDEVQTGIGRTGKPFAHQHFGLEPDIFTTAKGLGNGLPVGAMIGKAHLKEAFGAGSHGSTFGGNPVAMAAAKATLEEIFQPAFLQDVEEKGQFFKEQLQTALASSDRVKEVRGKELILGIECVDAVGDVILQLQKEGLLVLVAGPNVIRLLPPLIVSKEEIEIAVKKLANALK